MTGQKEDKKEKEKGEKKEEKKGGGGEEEGKFSGVHIEDSFVKMSRNCDN